MGKLLFVRSCLILSTSSFENIQTLSRYAIYFLFYFFYYYYFFFTVANFLFHYYPQLFLYDDAIQSNVNAYDFIIIIFLLFYLKYILYFVHVHRCVAS